MKRYGYAGESARMVERVDGDWVRAEDVGVLAAENARVTAERDAYCKAKTENDERFISERDAAIAEVAKVRKCVDEAVDIMSVCCPDSDQYGWWLHKWFPEDFIDEEPTL